MNLQASVKLKPMKQAHIESCLASCLFYLLDYHKGIKTSKKDEVNLLVKGSDYYKPDFSIGHLIHISQKYDMTAELFMNYKPYVNLLLKENFPRSLQVKHAKIDEKFIRKITGISPIILYLDKFHLIDKDDMVNRYHYPHFVIVKSFDKKVSLLDPWDGREKELIASKFMESVRSLQKRIWLSPRAIRLS